MLSTYIRITFVRKLIYYYSQTERTYKMNILYIVLPIMVISLAALIIIKPKLLVLNKKHTRYLRNSKPYLTWNIPNADKTTARFVKHPPILSDSL